MGRLVRSGADPWQRGEQATAAQLVAELGGQAVPLVSPQTTQMAEQHESPQRDRQADQQLQAELQHGCGVREGVASAKKWRRRPGQGGEWESRGGSLVVP